MSTSRHTTNPAPALMWGKMAREAPSIDSILDITPMVLDFLRRA
jgi:hypothetical protein